MGFEIIGREDDLALVDAFIDEAQGGPAALVLEGEPGMGKTTIVRAALGRAAAAGLRVFAARPAAGEAELPYVGLADLLATASRDFLAELPGAQRYAIEAALVRGGSGAVIDSHALSRAVLELLRFEAASGDLVLVVDDVQWLDRPTVAALTFALRRIGPLPVRLLVAMRTDGSRAQLPFGLVDWDDVRRVEVGALSATDLGALLARRLGEQLPRPRLEALRRASGGNPMFALELARQDDSAKASRFPTLPLVLEQRLRTLDSDTRAALTVAAAALQPSADLLLRAGVGRAELRSALASGILEVDGERLSFAHPLLGAAAYELLLPDERRQIHARLAAASLDAVERGHHVSRSAANPDEAAAQSLDDAAEAAASLGDHAAAAEFLVRAAELSLDPIGEPVQQREVRAAEELQLSGDVEAAATLARSLVGRLPRGVARARARWTLVSCTVGSGRSYEEGLGELALALEDAEADDATSAQLHVEMAETYAGMGRLEQSLGHLDTAIELATRAGATAVQAVALGYVGLFGCLLGRDTADSARRGLALWDESIGSSVAYSPRMSLAEVCIYATEFAEAERLYREEIAMAEERGLEAVEVIARCHLAETQLRAGRWSAALSNARLGVAHARQAAHPQIITGVLYALAMVEALLGHHEEARARATEALAAAEATDDFWHTVNNRSVLGLVALAEDDPEGAVEALEPAWSLMLERGLGDLSIFPVAHVLGEALVAVGRLDDALAVAETLLACPVGKRPWCQAMARRCTALAASARGDHVGARLAIEAALQAHIDLPEPFEHARTLQLSGRVERSARNWGAARAVLVDALERFDALGAGGWAERTAADLARLPGRRPADAHELTTREREIAELVAGGLANKEVATRLFVSLRTVEATLTKVYAKLEVRSRTELAGRLDRPGNA